jgi:hypothetical protein
VVQRSLCILALIAGCSGGDDPTKDWVANSGAPAHVVGHAFIFGPNTASLSLEGATVAVAELPTVSTTVAADGTFAFDVPSGGPSSFSLKQPGFHDNQSAAIDIGADGIAMLGFQAPTDDGFQQLADIVRITPDPAKCQISSTVSHVGTTPYGGDGLGEPGSTVTIDPMPDGALGPVYFAFAGTPGSIVIYPDPTLTETSMDGGVIYANVPVGEYTMTAHKAGVAFSTVTIRCRAGVLVNAAPPNGIQGS